MGRDSRRGPPAITYSFAAYGFGFGLAESGCLFAGPLMAECAEAVGAVGETTITVIFGGCEAGQANNQIQCVDERNRCYGSH